MGISKYNIIRYSPFIRYISPCSCFDIKHKKLHIAYSILSFFIYANFIGVIVVLIGAFLEQISLNHVARSYLSANFNYEIYDVLLPLCISFYNQEAGNDLSSYLGALFSYIFGIVVWAHVVIRAYLGWRAKNINKNLFTFMIASNKTEKYSKLLLCINKTIFQKCSVLDPHIAFDIYIIFSLCFLVGVGIVFDIYIFSIIFAHIVVWKAITVIYLSKKIKMSLKEEVKNVFYYPLWRVKFKIYYVSLFIASLYHIIMYILLSGGVFVINPGGLLNSIIIANFLFNAKLLQWGIDCYSLVRNYDVE